MDPDGDDAGPGDGTERSGEERILGAIVLAVVAALLAVTLPLARETPQPQVLRMEAAAEAAEMRP